MQLPEDTYRTVADQAEATYKDKGSKFLAYAFHAENEEEIRLRLEALRKRYYDATHHCYAWRLGPQGESFRANDDGEPSSTAGRPILGQLLSREITNALIVVVRYFGGTKLGVPGLIAAYKQSAALVLDAAGIEERTVNAIFGIEFGYLAMNDVMKAVKEEQPTVLSQHFDLDCRMELSIRRSRENALREKLEQAEGVHIEQKGYK